MLRKIGLTLAALFFMAVKALFLDFTGTIHAWLGWMAKLLKPFVQATIATLRVDRTVLCYRISSNTETAPINSATKRIAKATSNNKL